MPQPEPCDDAPRLAALSEVLVTHLTPVPEVVADLAERMKRWNHMPAATPRAVAEAICCAVAVKVHDAALLLNHAHQHFWKRSRQSAETRALADLFWLVLPLCGDCYALVASARGQTGPTRRAYSVGLKTEAGAEVFMAGLRGRRVWLQRVLSAPEARASTPSDDPARVRGVHAISLPYRDIVIDPQQKLVTEAIVDALCRAQGWSADTPARRLERLRDAFGYEEDEAPVEEALPYYVVLNDSDAPDDSGWRWEALALAIGGILPTLELVRLLGPANIEDEGKTEIHIRAVLRREDSAKEATP